MAGESVKKDRCNLRSVELQTNTLSIFYDFIKNRIPFVPEAPYYMTCLKNLVMLRVIPSEVRCSIFRIFFGTGE